jgi:ferredoxin
MDLFMHLNIFKTHRFDVLFEWCAHKTNATMMPKIFFRDSVIECKAGDNLRKVLLKNGLSPYNGIARFINCRGMGTCGTCAVKIDGKVSKKSKIERWRLSFPPHKPADGLRLACQCTVEGNLTIQKGKGIWGHRW